MLYRFTAVHRIGSGGAPEVAPRPYRSGKGRIGRRFFAFVLIFYRQLRNPHYFVDLGHGPLFNIIFKEDFQQ